MKIKITPQGRVMLLYEEEVGLAEALGGKHVITRASHVEPDHKGDWWARMIVPESGLITLGPFSKRSEALKAEIQYLETNLLH